MKTHKSGGLRTAAGLVRGSLPTESICELSPAAASTTHRNPNVPTRCEQQLLLGCQERSKPQKRAAYVVRLGHRNPRVVLSQVGRLREVVAGDVVLLVGRAAAHQSEASVVVAVIIRPLPDISNHVLDAERRLAGRVAAHVRGGIAGPLGRCLRELHAWGTFLVPPREQPPVLALRRVLPLPRVRQACATTPLRPPLVLDNRMPVNLRLP